MTRVMLKKARHAAIAACAALALAICAGGYADADSPGQSPVRGSARTFAQASGQASGQGSAQASGQDSAGSPAQASGAIIKKGDYVCFGSYNNEPILWRAVNIDANKNTLLWSDKIITLKAFDATGISVNNVADSERKRVGSNFWAQSSLRDWLNSNATKVGFAHQPPDDRHIWMGVNSYENEAGFLSNFTPEDQKLIVPYKHKSILAECDSFLKSGGKEGYKLVGSRNPAASVSNYDNAYFQWVTDKVFLLDIKDLSEYVAKNGFPHRKQLTEAAVKQSEFKADYLFAGNYYMYWIPTPQADTASTLLKVSEQGIIGEGAIDNRNFGVAPALYISPQYAVLSGKGTADDPYIIYMSGGNPEGYKSEAAKLVKKQALADAAYKAKNSAAVKAAAVKPATTKTSLKQPVLKWAYGGAYQYWCEDGGYSTPAIADLNGDGRLEIVGSAYSIVNLDADTGKLNWRIGSGHDITEPDAKYEGRTFPDIIIDDIDKDGKPEIVTAHGKGYVSVYDNTGRFKPGWPQKPINKEFRALKVADLDLDGKKEIIASAAVNAALNTWVFDCNGKIRKGWPQYDGSVDPATNKKQASAWGVFSNSISVGDVNMDGYPDIVVPSDLRFICVYDRNGALLLANPVFGDNKKWGLVGVWESYGTELKQENSGWGYPKTINDPREERFTTNFSRSGSVVVDIDKDGKNEVIITGYVFDSAAGMPPSLYTTAFIFNGDRTRFNNGIYNWEESPKDLGKPLAEDWNLISDASPIPVVTDIDRDGANDILFSAYDGMIHCISLDKKEKNSWPFNVYDPQKETYEFASTPAVVDLDKDGYQEVVVSTWTEKESKYNGRLLILNFKGELIYQTALPQSRGSKLTSGGLARPLIADIDGDNQYEAVLNTVYAGIVAYDLPGSKVK